MSEVARDLQQRQSTRNHLKVLYWEIPTEEKQHSVPLGQVVIKLPVSSNEAYQSPNHDITSDAKQLFEKQLSFTGGLIEFPQNPLIDQISYTIANDLKTLILTPIFLNNNLQIEFHKLVLKLPDHLLQNCISAVKLDHSKFLIDMLTQLGLFITLSFDLENFTSQSTPKLSAQNFPQWGSIDMPYSIETRKPHFIKTLAENLTIIPFVDGGLLQLKRNSKFEQIETILFTDSSYLDNITRFFKRKKTPDDELINNNNINVRTTISCALLGRNNEFLITLSIDKKLKVWSLETNSIILEQELIASDLHSYLDYQPSNLIQIIDSPSANEFRLVTAIPLPKNHQKFIVWNLAISDNSEVLLQEITKFQLPKLDLFVDLSWIIQSYKVYKISDYRLKIFFLCRSNFASKVIVCDFDLQTNEYEWIDTKSYVVADAYQQPNEVTNSQFPETVNEYYVKKLAATYNEVILETVLKVFEDHYGHTTNEKKGLIERTIEIVNFNLDQDDYEFLKILKNQWLKFDGSCNELLKQSYEPVDLLYIENKDMCYVLKSMGNSIFKKTSLLELVHCQDQGQALGDGQGAVNYSNLSQLVSLSRDFKLIYNQELLDELKLQLLQPVDFQDSALESVMSSLFDQLLSPGLTEELINQLLTRLGSIPNVLQVIEHISNNLEEDPSAVSKTFVSSRLSSLGTSLLLESFKQVLDLYSDFTLGLLMIMLTIDNNDQVRVYFSKLLHNLQSLKLVEKVLIDSNTGDSLFTDVIFKHFKVKGFKISDSDSLNEIVSKILNFTLSTDSFLVNTVAYLVSQNRGPQVIKSGIIDFLDSKSAVHVFIKGIVYLNGGNNDMLFKILTNISEDIIQHELSDRELDDLEFFSTLVDVIGSKSLVKYYLKLTELFMKKDDIKNAYSLLKLSLKYSETDAFETQHDLIHWNLFQLSLKLSDYDTSFRSIQLLSSELKLKSIKIFVLHLLEQKSISVLLNYNFKHEISTVDEIILDLANQQDFISNSLYYYKILYTLRLKIGNKRAAAELLYQFISKYQLQSASESSLEAELRSLYLIILNVIKTIKDSQDQWIINRVENGDNKIKTIHDLQSEYDLRF